MYTEFRTEVLPPADRLAAWQQVTAELLPTTVTTMHEDDFLAAVRTVALDDVRVSVLDLPSHEVYRSPRQIRQHDPDQVMAWFGLGSTLDLDVTDRACSIHKGNYLLYSSSRPFRTLHGRGARGLLLQVPARMLPSPKIAGALFSAALPGDGLGGLLSRYLIELVTHAGGYRPADASRLSTVTVDLFTAFLHGLDPDGARTTPEARQRVLWLRVHDYIERRLGDPDLSPRTVAAAHAISVRTLYHLFEKENLTVADWIRRRRLERCRQDLADPLLSHRTIQSIGSRWGLTDPAHFSRAFRKAYATSPTDYRKRSVGGVPAG
ncbi:helix-turn-helix domain-containing protein [Micromonospora zhanjiangensis]|uniref:Helix-turn-helix domain-containing protein n=1 Tax=Micromonospora zhanjiangensis TaxID=1522057 RepID=A0ABV8KSZ1_9ACTN